MNTHPSRRRPVAAARGRFVSMHRGLAVAGLVAGVAAVTVLTVGAGTGSAAAAPAGHKGAPAPGSQYVALGDSYAAGYGIGTSTGKPVAGCAQSTKDYPHQVAAALKLKLVDVSCSGAVTANIDRTPQDTGDGTAPLQDRVLSKRTKLVTVTIGGNDLGFASIAQYCIAASANGPLVPTGTNPHPGLNCKAHYDPAGGPDQLAATVRDVVVPRVARVLRDIHAKAPNAAVYFVDYPAISTTAAGSGDPASYPAACYRSPALAQSFPFTSVDTVYLQQVQQYLNARLKSRVHRSGDHFVESYPQSLAHSACADTKDPWMIGITLQTTPSPGTKPGSLHPNREGADHLTAEALAAIGPYRPARSSRSSGAARATSTSPAASAAAASSTALASSGAAHTWGLSVTGAVLVLAGTTLLVLTRAGRRRGRRTR